MVWTGFMVPVQAAYPLIWVVCWDAVNLPIAMGQTLVQIQTGSFHVEECGLASLYGDAFRKKKNAMNKVKWEIIFFPAKSFKVSGARTFL